jgi:diacylglycerol kinase (ATP)
MALLVCQSRVEGGVHNLYQVLSGAAIGSLAAVAIFQLL